MVEVLEKVWLDGEVYSKDDAKVSLFSAGLVSGIAVFEDLTSYITIKGKAVFKLDDRLENFFATSERYGLNLRISKKALKNAILNLVSQNELPCFLRILAFNSSGPFFSSRGNVASVAVIPFAKNLKPKQIKINIFNQNYPNYFIDNENLTGHDAFLTFVRKYARKNLCYDSMIFNEKNNLVRTSRDFLLFTAHEKIFVPNTVLITRDIKTMMVIQIIKDLGYDVHWVDINKDNLRKIEGVYIVGNYHDFVPVDIIDGRPIASSEIQLYKEIDEQLKFILGGNDESYAHLLDLVNLQELS